MKIYDISQEVFGCEVYPGDPAPEKRILSSIGKGDQYNLTAFSMCAHNGTHIDAPAHFLEDGKTVDELALSTLVGEAFVAECNCDIDGIHAREILLAARKSGNEAWRRLLIKGNATVTLSAAELFVSSGVLLIGAESQTVGPADAPMAVHIALLGGGVVILEGVRLGAVPEGAYLLNAAPLSLAGADGAPCRAWLAEL